MKTIKCILLVSFLGINSCTIDEEFRPVFPPDLEDIEGDIIAFKINGELRISYNEVSFGYGTNAAGIEWWRRKTDEDGNRFIINESIRISIRDFSPAVNYYTLDGLYEEEDRSRAYYANKPIRPETVFHTDSLHTGYVEFIRFDPETSDDRRAAGYFQFDAVKHSTGEVVKITQGHFSVRIN